MYCSTGSTIHAERSQSSETSSILRRGCDGGRWRLHLGQLIGSGWWRRSIEEPMTVGLLHPSRMLLIISDDKGTYKKGCTGLFKVCSVRGFDDGRRPWSPQDNIIDGL